MDFIKNVFGNKKNISILSVCILVLSLVMFNSITGNTYAADTSGDTSGDVGTQATYQCYQCNSSGALKWKAGAGADSDCPGGYHLYSSTMTQAECGNGSKTVYAYFNSNGGTPNSFSTKSCEIAAGKARCTIGVGSYDPDRSGYKFLGWDDTKSCDYPSTTSVSISENTSFYGCWKALSYTITFNGNGGTINSSSTTTRTIKYGGKYISSLGTVSVYRNGYKFKGWYDAVSGGNTISDSTTVSKASNHTVYAQWTPMTYTVSFYDVYGNTYDDKTVTYGSGYGTLPAPTKSGYIFTGWHLDAAVGDLITSTTKVSKAANHTLYATWDEAPKVTVSYYSNGADHIPYSTVTLTVGSKYTFPSVTKTGYHVVGWYDYDASTSTWGTTKITTDTEVKKTTNHTVGVKWEANTYSVVYNGNKSTSGSMTNSSHTYDTAKALTANSYKRTNYKFNGWNTKADGTGTKYSNKAEVKNLVSTNGGSITLYARWTYVGSSSSSEDSTPKDTHKVIINYNPNGGDVAAITDAGSWSVVNDLIHLDGKKYETTVEYGSKLGTNGLTDYYSGVNLRITKEGFDAKAGAEWICLSGCSTIGKTFNHSTLYSHSDFCDASDSDCTVVLGVNWQSNKYTIKYNGNGNTSGSTADSSHIIGVESSLTKNGFVKDGATFKGWNTKADGTGVNYSDEQKVKNLSSKANETITLYAIWVAEGSTSDETVKTYTVKYNSNGGTGTLADSTHKYGYASNLSLNTFTKMGCEFIGWNTKKDGTGISYSDGQTISNLSSTDGAFVTLYAQWSLKGNSDVDNGTSGDGASTSEMKVNLSLDKSYTDRLNLSVNVSNLKSGVSAVCEVYLIPDAGTGYETGSSKIVATINNCKNGNNAVSINNLKADTKYTFQVMVSTDDDMALGDKYVTYKTSSESIIENITESPKTGMLAVLLVSLISIGSLGGVFYYFKKVKK